ncbi:MAG: hypothetical protein L0I24_26060 [Pseudonocardia sp.]|nr:hypothetical protein [Pseudonocardia sp.]
MLLVSVVIALGCGVYGLVRPQAFPKHSVQRARMLAGVMLGCGLLIAVLAVVQASLFGGR